MNEFLSVKEINLKDIYVCDIKGFGEIYEMMSVRKLQKRLIRRFKDGYLFLVSNRDHSGFGYTHEELVQLVRNKNLEILDSGYIDSFILKSKPKRKGEINPLVKQRIFFILAKLFFYFLLKFEFLFRNKNTSHMIYVLVSR